MNFSAQNSGIVKFRCTDYDPFLWVAFLAGLWSLILDRKQVRCGIIACLERRWLDPSISWLPGSLLKFVLDAKNRRFLAEGFIVLNRIL